MKKFTPNQSYLKEKRFTVEDFSGDFEFTSVLQEFKIVKAYQDSSKDLLKMRALSMEFLP